MWLCLSFCVSRRFEGSSALETTGNTNSATRHHIAEELNPPDYIVSYYYDTVLESNTVPFIINDEAVFKTLSLFYMFLHGKQIVHVLFIKQKLHNLYCTC